MSLLFAIVVFAIAFHSLVDEPRRKSPAEFRRAKQFYKAEAAARRYAALPATARWLDVEKRERKILKRAKAAVSWAIVGEDFSQQEADGAILLALRRDKTLAGDSAKLHEAALSILKTATCQN